MSDNFTINETLHRYLDGELEPEAAAGVEKELAVNEALRDELQHLRLARYGIQHLGLKNQVAAIHQQMMTELAPRQTAATPVPAIKRTKWWMAAAAAAVTLLVVLFIVMQQQPGSRLSAGELYAANYRVYETTVVRGNAGALETAYTQKQYGQVIQLFNGMQQPAIAHRFLTACALLETGGTAKAVELFDGVISDNKNGLATGYLEDAEYYRALALLKQGHVKAALPVFQAIHDNKQHLYNDKVTGKWIAQLKQLK